MEHTIAYATKTLPPSRPTQDSAFCIPAFLAFLTTVTLEAALVGLAYYRSPTYWCERFGQTVGDRDVYISIMATLSYIGAAMAAIALLAPFRKRGAALLALGCNGFAGMVFGIHYPGDDWELFANNHLIVYPFGIAVLAISIILWRIGVDWIARRRIARYPQQSPAGSI